MSKQMLVNAAAAALRPVNQVQKEASALLPLRTENLRLELAGKRLIQGIDLTIAQHNVTLIMGPNGSGKSVLLRLLHGLMKPSQGTISYHNEEFNASHRLQQAMVFQRPVLLRRSVAANLDFALKLRKRFTSEGRDQLLEKVGLLARAKSPARLLSGGEQQRLALARALAMQPRLLFLDEPTANLDPSSTQVIEDLVLGAHKSGMKIVFVTHDIGQAQRLGGEVVFLNHGRVIEQQNVQQFIANPASNEAKDYLDGRLVF